MRRDKQEAPRYRGAFLLASLLHFCSGQLLQNLSGVDSIDLSGVDNITCKRKNTGPLPVIAARLAGKRSG